MSALRDELGRLQSEIERLKGLVNQLTLMVPNGGYADDMYVRVFQYLNEIAPYVDHLSAGECEELARGVCAAAVHATPPMGEARS